MTTKLEAINTMLSCIGQSPLNSLEGTKSYFTIAAEKILEDEVFGVLDGMFKGKKYISVKDRKYKKKVENWYKHKLIRKIRLRFFLKMIKGKSVEK